MKMRPTVIVYHAIGDRPPQEDPHELLVHQDVFAEQVDFLARRRSVVPLEDIIRGDVRTPKPAVAITFDDAYRSVLEIAAPMLERHGLSSTVFVPTHWIGLQNGWIDPPSRPLDVMGEEELLEVERRGIRVESHGSRHIRYWESDPIEVEADVRSSLERLTDVLGRRPRHLAYPYGPTSPEAARVVERCGLEAAFTLEEPPKGRFAMERAWIRPRYGLRVFAMKTSGYWSASWRWSKPGRAAAAVLRPFAGRQR